MEPKQSISTLSFLIPIVISLLFAAFMAFLAIISTEKARNHYGANRTEEGLQKLFRPENYGTNQLPLVKEKSWFVKCEFKLEVQLS